MNSSLESHAEAGDYRIDSFGVQFGETDAGRSQEFVTGMFDVMLVIGIVDDTLQVAFIVAYLHFQFIDVFLHRDDFKMCFYKDNVCLRISFHVYRTDFPIIRNFMRLKRIIRIFAA